MLGCGGHGVGGACDEPLLHIVFLHRDFVARARHFVVDEYKVVGAGLQFHGVVVGIGKGATRDVAFHFALKHAALIGQHGVGAVV